MNEEGAQQMRTDPREVFRQTQCFILDMDGTIYLGDRLFGFTIPFLEELGKRGTDYYFFTNNSSRNAGVYVDKLKKMGIAITPDRMMTANDVILRHIRLNYPGTGVYLVGTVLLHDDFRNAGVRLVGDETADMAVLGFDTELTYEKLRICCDIVRAGRPILGVNPDFNCPVENGFIPDCGSMARLVEASTGVLPEFFGKPSRHALDYIVDKTGYPEEALCFVGDRLYTDIAIARDGKCKSVLVLTGETKREDLESSPHRPSLVLENLSEILKYL